MRWIWALGWMAGWALWLGCGGIPGSVPIADGWDPQRNDSEPVIKTGVLEADEVWKGVVLVSRELIVPERITLTIEPGSRVQFMANVEPSSKIVVKGSFYAQGDFNTPIFFNAEDARTKLWHGIFLEETSASRIAYAQFQLESRIHCQSNTAQIVSCQLSDSNGAALSIESSAPTVEDCVIRTNAIGIRCMRQASPDILNNTIIGNTYGIVCEDGSQPTIARNVIANNRQHGIFSQGASSPHITNNNIARNGGYAALDGGRLSDNFIQGNNGAPPNFVEVSLNPQNSQVFGVEEIVSARSSPVPEAGDRRLLP